MELLAHPNALLCLFPEMTSFYKQAVREQLNAMVKGNIPLSKTNLLEMIKQPMASSCVNTSAYCMVHECVCECRRARTNISGIPCVDWSPQGSKGRAQGKTFVVFACWAALRRKLQESCIILECSDRYDAKI